MNVSEMPRDFDAAFLDDMPYEPRALLFDQLLEVDAGRSLVRCRLPTDRATPLSEHQRTHPRFHPSHVSGGVLIHATGMLGFVHAYYVLGLRHRSGWIGYGTHIERARFRKLVEPGAPLVATCRVTHQRLGRVRHVLSYHYEFTRSGDVYYEGEQGAVWLDASKIAPRPASTPHDRVPNA